jgi:uncharacterized membrane protein
MLLAGQALVVEAALKVPWAQTPMYNTIMSVAAGVGLLLVVALGRELYLHRSVVAEAWALAFGVLGFLLTITGAHMSFTWPLSSIAPFDNIIFGEPSLAFGVMLVAAAVLLWSRPALFNAAVEPGDDARLIYVRRVSLPLSIFAAAMGLGCFGIAAAGWAFTLFAAPPQEPISGTFANYPLLEATFISGLYVLVGLGAVLFPVALWRPRRQIVLIIGVCWTLAGLAFTGFGALNYFTHIGLIIHTS